MLAPALVPPPPPPPCPCLEREISDFHSTPRRHRSTSRRNRTNSVNYRPISMRTFFSNQRKTSFNFTKRLKIVLQFSSAGFPKILFFSRISPHLRYLQGKLINHDKFLINFTHILFVSDWFIKLRKLKVK